MWGYVEDVIAGRRAACRELRWGCERYKRDYESEEWEYRIEEADFVIDKIETQCHHRQGENLDGNPLQGKPLRLESLLFTGS